MSAQRKPMSSAQVLESLRDQDPHERAPRVEKVLRFVEAAVMLLRDGKTLLTAKQAFTFASHWDDDAWKRVAIIAGQKPPSEEAKKLVLASLARMIQTP